MNIQDMTILMSKQANADPETVLAITREDYKTAPKGGRDYHGLQMAVLRKALKDRKKNVKVAGYGYTPPIPIDMAKIQIMADPFMTPYDKMKATGMFDQANSLAGNTGIVNSKHLAGTLVRTGLNMATANFAGKVVGSLFGLSTESMDMLRAQGVVYSGLKGLGII